METALWIAALWTAFGASHMALSSQRWRPLLVARLGEGPFLRLYSLVALAVALRWLHPAMFGTG